MKALKGWMRIAVGTAIGLLIMGIVGGLYWIGGWEPLELMTYDARFQMRGPRPASDKILVITLDEETNEVFHSRGGDITRSYYARVITNMANAGAEIIALDLDFSKPGLDPQQDLDLSNAINQAGNVILARFVSGGGNWSEPLSIFGDQALDEAIINMRNDPDGKARRMSPYGFATFAGSATQGTFYYTLGVDAAYHFLHRWPHGEPRSGPGWLTLRPVPPAPVPGQPNPPGGAEEKTPLTLRLDPQGDVLIDYVGGPWSFKTMSFHRAWAGDFSPSLVRGKIVFLGSTRATDHDYYPTPFVESAKKDVAREQTWTPGVEIHANLAQTVLDGSYLQRWPRLQGLELILAVGLVTLVLSVLLNLPTSLRLLLFLLFAGGAYGVSQWVFDRSNQWIELVPVEAIVLLNFVGGIVYQRILDSREKAMVTQTFGRYVSPQVVDHLMKNPDLIRLGGEKKTLTVMFSDIRSFTTLSESLDPEALVHLLNEYLTEMTAVVFENGGVVDKFIGDAIMALFGAPVYSDEHPKQGVRTALGMLKRLKVLTDGWKAQGRPVIDIGIGLNTGVMTVGNMGSEQRFDYTVIGDSVNLASRLEGLNKQYGTRIIVSEFTRGYLDDEFVCRELDLVRVKGKKEPVKIFEVLGLAAEAGVWAPFLTRFQEGLRLYRARAWDEAIAAFESSLKIRHDDRTAQEYIQRAQALRENPPEPDWDGVVVMKTK